MIRPADRSDLLRLSCADPFYTRILSVFESYGDVPFADCWVQDISTEIVSAVSRFEDKFSLYLTGSSDREEVAAFLRCEPPEHSGISASLGIGEHVIRRKRLA